MQHVRLTSRHYLFVIFTSPSILLSLHNQITLVRPHHPACTPLIYSNITRSIHLGNAPNLYYNHPFDQVLSMLNITYYFPLFYTSISLLYFPHPILEISTQESTIIWPNLFIYPTSKISFNLIHKYTKNSTHANRNIAPFNINFSLIILQIPQIFQAQYDHNIPHKIH